MITRNEIKYFASLNQKKFRRQENKFIAEGEKTVTEGINANYTCEIVLTTDEYSAGNPEIIHLIKKRHIRVETVKKQDFEKLSETKSPQGIAAVFEKRKIKFDINITAKENIIVYLDNISDPGNAGTIIRTCDWFGVKNVLFSVNSAEYLNPKVIRASMGSLFHLNLFDADNKDLLELKTKGFKVMCTDIRGVSVFNNKKPEKLVLVLSSESTGPSTEIINLADERITIPGKGRAESLNVAAAAAIILAEYTFSNKYS